MQVDVAGGENKQRKKIRVICTDKDQLFRKRFNCLRVVKGYQGYLRACQHQASFKRCFLAPQ